MSEAVTLTVTVCVASASRGRGSASGRVGRGGRVRSRVDVQTSPLILFDHLKTTIAHPYKI